MKPRRVGPTVCDTALCLQDRGPGAAEGVLFSTAGQSWQTLTHSLTHSLTWETVREEH